MTWKNKIDQSKYTSITTRCFEYKIDYQSNQNSWTQKNCIDHKKIHNQKTFLWFFFLSLIHFFCQIKFLKLQDASCIALFSWIILSSSITKRLINHKQYDCSQNNFFDQKMIVQSQKNVSIKHDFQHKMRFQLWKKMYH